MALGTIRRENAALYAVFFLNAFITFGCGVLLQLALSIQYTGSTRLLLGALVVILFLLPFVLFPRVATQLCEQHGKGNVIQRLSSLLLGLSVLFALSCSFGWLTPTYILLFLAGTQAALFAPAKYALMGERVGVEYLAEANGRLLAVNAAALGGASMFAVSVLRLSDTDPGSAIAEALQALAPCSWLFVAAALLQLGLLHRSTLTASPESRAVFAWRAALQEVGKVELRALWQDSGLRASALGVALLLMVTQSLTLALPLYLTPFRVPEGSFVLDAPLTAAVLGVFAGALFGGHYSRRYLETGLLPLGVFGLTFGIALLALLQPSLLLTSVLALIGAAAALWLVPLRALLQYYAPANANMRVLALSHALTAALMLLWLLFTLGYVLLGWNTRGLLQLDAVVAIAAALYLLFALPQSLTRFLMNGVVATRYRIKVQGMRHIPVRGGVLLLGNHVSWIDWAVVQIACPRPVRFVLNSDIYELWYLRWFFRRFGCIPIQAGAASRQALADVAEALRRGEVVCLFPEGVVSRNGNLGEFRRAYERACQEVDDDVVIVPFYLRGLWGSLPQTSKPQHHRARHTINREVVVDFGAPLPKSTPAHELKRKVGELSNLSWREYADHLPTLGEHWIDSCTKSGNPVVLMDTFGTALRARTALTGSLILARRMRKLSHEQNVGLLLPSSTGSVLGNFALFLCGKTVVNLNFTAPVETMLSAIEQAEVETIYTSARFLDKLAARGVVLEPLRERCRFIMLEDLRASASIVERLITLAATWMLPASWLKWFCCTRTSNQQAAVIMFSSGSEGSPKGVVLTHRNLLCNVKQFTELLNPEDEDVMLANLPPFHAFGLTVTHLMPLLERLPVVCHPDPTDVHGAALAIAKHRVTILLGTSSFLRLYVRNHKVHPLMLESLRLVVAGAEKLHEDVRREFREKFNKEILEGYGATETAPVASVNMPDRLSPDNWRVQVGNKVGSVGLPLPGTSFRIVDPETYRPLPTGEAGMVLISGAQVMQGYLKNEQKSQSALLSIDGLSWYVTGDKGYLDEDGFLYILDRYSRFAKVGGEMVGLGTVEHTLRTLLPDPELELVVVSAPDEKKGEKLIVLSNRPLDPANLRERLMALGLNPLAFPSHYFHVEAIPRLGSGKVDYAGAKRLGLSLLHDNSGDSA